MCYQHLALEERYQIYAFRKAGFSLRSIAAELHRSPSTISRELRRNRHKRGYRPAMAQRLATARAHTSRTRVRMGFERGLPSDFVDRRLAAPRLV